jgi:D-alanyl-D-alanine carboxypeptidase (penicillin-binding protein 5/6)
MPKKNILKLFSIITCIVFILNFNLSCIFAKNNYEPKALNIQTAATSAILLEQSTGRILYEKNSHERMSPASITKVMTLLLAMEAIEKGKLKLTDTITCSEHAASMGGSTICFGTGEHLSCDNVLKGIVVSSGNDAAVSMAERIGGSEANFVNMMNQRAKELGMKDTHFVNACGLDAENHYSSAYDISIMSLELLKHPLIFNYTKIWSGKLYYPERKDPKKREFNLFNTNKLIRFYQGANGIKTGSTGKAKFCLSGAAVRNGMQLIAVVMGCANNKERFKEASQLLNIGFDNYQISNIVRKNTIMSKIEVEQGKVDNVPVVTERDANALMQKGESLSIKKEMKLNKLKAPVKKGDVAGYILYKANGNEICKVKLIVASDVNRMSVRDSLNKILEKFFKFD